jgi:ribosome-associated protein
MDVIDLGHGIRLPLSELDFSFSRSGGPGGQHVNRAETKVELRWDVAASGVLTDEQKATLLERLQSHLTTDGILRLTSEESRSQHRNRALVLERLQELVAAALRPRRKRRPTRPPAAAQARRLERKKQRSEVKERRRKIDPRRW